MVRPYRATTFGAGLALLVASVVFAPTSALAGKPEPVITWSNGYPSGPHFNLNIHGKKASYVCDPTPGGGSVFVLEYGTDEIDFVQNSKSSVTELVAKDPCGVAFTGNDPVLVQLPAGEYQVYARILAKPSKDATTRQVVFFPKLIEACNDTGSGTFGDAVNCTDAFLLGTGVVTSGGFLDPYTNTFTRSTGKSKAVDITAAFQWTGYACDQWLDTNNDGLLTVADFPGLTDLNGDFLINDADLALHLATLVGAGCTYFGSEWVFNLADLVVYGWDYVNSGSKLLQVRFYPKSTTTFE